MVEPGLRVVVVGAGAWGLPAAAELARRGADVVSVDSYGPGNALSSSSGPTRIWRLAHPDRLKVRLGIRAEQAWRRIESLTGTQLALTQGIVWRCPDSTAAVAEALSAEGVEYELLDAADVGSRFPGLVPNGLPAVYQPLAGPLLAAASLAVHEQLFRAAGGRSRWGDSVITVELDGDGVIVVLSSGQRLYADRVVVAPGPWAEALLERLGVTLPLAPVLQQVGYVDGPGAVGLPCLWDGPFTRDDGTVVPGLYGMANPGPQGDARTGYKVGLEIEVGRFDVDDADRSGSDELDVALSERVEADLRSLSPVVRARDVCSWTYSPDGKFVIDTLWEGRLILACGDSGEGFKFSALMGPLLADLVQGIEPDDDVASFGFARFAAGFSDPRLNQLGRPAVWAQL